MLKVVCEHSDGDLPNTTWGSTAKDQCIDVGTLYLTPTHQASLTSGRGASEELDSTEGQLSDLMSSMLTSSFSMSYVMTS